MLHIDRAFIVIAILYALLGQVLGIWMGINQDFGHRHLHAHINLVGWVSLALAGLVYRSYPKMAGRALARWHFWVANLGALLLTSGIFIVNAYDVEIVVVVGSLLAIVATAMLLANALAGME